MIKLVFSGCHLICVASLDLNGWLDNKWVELEVSEDSFPNSSLC